MSKGKGKPKTTPKATRRAKAPDTSAWRVDSEGRWRDARGHFVSRQNVLSAVKRARSPEAVADMLGVAGARVPGRRGAGDSRKTSYYVAVKFESKQTVRGRRVIDHGWRSVSHAASLKAALYQAQEWLTYVLPHVSGYDVSDVVLDVAIRPVKPGKQQAKARLQSAKAALRASAEARKTKRKTTKKGKKK